MGEVIMALLGGALISVVGVIALFAMRKDEQKSANRYKSE